MKNKRKYPLYIHVHFFSGLFVKNNDLSYQIIYPSLSLVLIAVAARQ